MRAFPEVVYADQWKVESDIGLIGMGPGIDWKRKVFRIPETPDAPQMHRELLIQLRMGVHHDPEELGKKIKQSPLSAVLAQAYQTGLTYNRIFSEVLDTPKATPSASEFLKFLAPERVPPLYRFAAAAISEITTNPEIIKKVLAGTSIATDEIVSKLWQKVGVDPDITHLSAGKTVLAELEGNTQALLYYYIPRAASEEKLTLNGGIKYIAKWLDKYLSAQGSMSERHIPEHELGCEGWGKVTWEECPMYVPAKFRTMLDHRRKLDAGVVPKHIGRLLSDQRLFDVKRKRPGGTVLIDTSGSMGLSEDDIDKLVMAAPGCAVAVYGGQGRDDGRMRMLAEKGFVAERQYRTRAGHGANLIDGPALMWLAKQNEPRFWVSDGMVTGTGETTSAALKAECKYICNRYHITRVPHVEEALHVFRRTVMVT